MSRTRLAASYALLVCVLSLICKAQSIPCTLKVEQLPEVRGFRLGMTAGDLKRRHPELPLGEPDEIGYAVTDVSEIYVNSHLRPSDADGLSGVKLAFLDDRLVRFRITYSGLTEWASVAEFLNATTSKLKLPGVNQWNSIDPHTRQLECDGVSVQARLEPKQGRYEVQRPSLAFVINNVDNLLSERKRAREERQQRRLQADAPQRPGTNTLSIEALIDTDAGDVPAAGATFFLLDADPLALFADEDVRLTRFLSEGEDEDEALVSEFLSSAGAVGRGSARGGGSYLQKFYTTAMAALKPHIIQTVRADSGGRASFSPMAAGTYHLIGSAEPPAYAVWHLKIDLAQPQTSLRLTRRNTMAGLRTQDADEQNERRQRQEAEKRRRVFKP